MKGSKIIYWLFKISVCATYDLGKKAVPKVASFSPKYVSVIISISSLEVETRNTSQEQQSFKQDKKTEMIIKQKAESKNQEGSDPQASISITAR